MALTSGGTTRMNPLMTDCGCRTATHNPLIFYCPLHAAAPKLVTALRGLLDMVTDNRVHGVELDAAVEALAHAEGRS